jgi:hypothetical protein
MTRKEFELTVPAKAHQWIRLYEKGHYAKLEVLSQLVSLAADVASRDLVSVLPKAWISLVREETKAPPRSPDDVRWISGAIYADDIDPEQHGAELCKTWFKGAWQWHRYFTVQSMRNDETEGVHE